MKAASGHICWMSESSCQKQDAEEQGREVEGREPGHGERTAAVATKSPLVWPASRGPKGRKARRSFIFFLSCGLPSVLCRFFLGISCHITSYHIISCHFLFLSFPFLSLPFLSGGPVLRGRSLLGDLPPPQPPLPLLRHLPLGAPPSPC